MAPSGDMGSSPQQSRVFPSNCKGPSVKLQVIGFYSIFHLKHFGRVFMLLVFALMLFVLVSVLMIRHGIIFFFFLSKRNF